VVFISQFNSQSLQSFRTRYTQIFAFNLMASLTPISQSRSCFTKLHLQTPPNRFFNSNSSSIRFRPEITRMPLKASVVVVSATTAEKPKKRYPGESKGFVEEMRFVAMKLHTKDQAKEGEKEVKEPEERPVAKWDPNVDGYLRFLVDSKLVYDTLEGIVDKAAFPSCEFLALISITIF
jgi:hypothetical protein